MNLARKAALAVTVTIICLGVAAVPAPAQATSWGCGGFCRTAGR